VNTKIRRLAVGLLVCYLALFVQLNVLQVGKQEELSERPAQRPSDDPRLQPPAR
jgi:cell division protein FtsI/penicillin-binding protein 2